MPHQVISSQHGAAFFSYFRRRKLSRLKTHEEKVERFYTHGSRKRARVAEGYLSFGYWDSDTADYLASAENLVRYFIREAKVEKPGVILNVACGNGTESLKFLDAFSPRKMFCIDITSAHIETASAKALELKNGEKIFFEKRNAVDTGYPDGMFSHVIGIEGPAHFNTRDKFFSECRRVLQTDGKLVLTDIILNMDSARRRFFLPALTRLISRLWHMPEANRVTVNEYREHLARTGFTDIRIDSIGDRVFNGFARNNIGFRSIMRAIRVRGPIIGLGLTAISWFLGYGYRMGIIDYIFVKARKED
jgi:ubiquinone/menaquinone biosynthesis C-methylase UbiE